jgi:hypothetical protein
LDRILNFRNYEKRLHKQEPAILVIKEKYCERKKESEENKIIDSYSSNAVEKI